jgi:hypothetical protein
MQKTYDEEEEVEEEGGEGNQSRKAAGHQEWVPDPSMEEEDSDQSWTAWVTGSGSLTRIGRRRRIRGVVGVIKLLGLILRGNEWHTKLLLVPLIKVHGEGRGWRWRGPRKERMTCLGYITKKILMQPVSPVTARRLLDRPGAAHGEDAKKALGQTNKKSPALTPSLARTTSSPAAVHRT